MDKISCREAGIASTDPNGELWTGVSMKSRGSHDFQLSQLNDQPDRDYGY